MTSSLFEQERTVACPLCNSTPGEMCTSQYDGHTLYLVNHVQRGRAWLDVAHPEEASR